MFKPRVAVIIPCYNAERYLSQTIESVLKQSFTSFEVITGNDGSTDNTAMILEQYSDRITVINHPDSGNHGQAATYNLCLQHVDSEYIAFIDNDDLWEPDKLQRQVDVLDRHPEVGLVYTNGDVINVDDKVLYSFFDPQHEETNRIGQILLDCYIRTPSTVMVRHEILKRAGDFKVGIVPDHDMWIRIKELTDFYYINDKLFKYRVHEQQLSQKSAEKMWRDGFGTLERALKRYPYPKYIKRKRLAVIHYRLAELGKKTRRFRLLPHIFLATYYDPSRALQKLMALCVKKLKSNTQLLQ